MTLPLMHYLLCYQKLAAEYTTMILVKKWWEFQNQYVCVCVCAGVGGREIKSAILASLVLLSEETSIPETFHKCLVLAQRYTCHAFWVQPMRKWNSNTKMTALLINHKKKLATQRGFFCPSSNQLHENSPFLLVFQFSKNQCKYATRWHLCFLF